MIVKVCGMRDAQNIRDVEKLGVDWIGMIFWPQSKRFVAEVPSYLPKHQKRVGVFVDAPLEDIRQHISDYQLNIIQLHGQESPDYVKALKPHTTIKAFNIAKADDLVQTEQYEGIADYFLFDTKGPFLLSGGIGLDDAESIGSFHHPCCIGIDLNSRFEISPALKDIDKLRTFLGKIKQ